MKQTAILTNSQHEIYADFNAILRDFTNDNSILHLQTLLPKKKLIVFVSSTFTDTHKERDILHLKILPRLQEMGGKFDVQVILYDMRFGVKDENTLDHSTWETCREAIYQCFAESDGLFFLSFQADKYGYLPLPKYVEKEQFDEIFKRENESQAKVDNRIVAMKEGWLKLDTNNVPPRYELKKLDSLKNDIYWEQVLPFFRDSLLDSLPFESLPRGDSGECLHVNRSVTEWETRYALSLDMTRVSWVHRSFEKESLKKLKEMGGKRADDLCDVLDNPGKQKKLEILKATMTSRMNVKEFKHISAVAYDSGDSEMENYLKEWEGAVSSLLVDSFNKVIDKQQSYLSLLQEIGIEKETMEEFIHHNNLARNKTRDFYGREALLDQALSLFSSGPVANTLSVDFAIIGKSGFGKTALMSKLASLVCKKDIPVVIRFCGTSSLSLQGIDLIQSIVMQQLLVYEEKELLADFSRKKDKQSYAEAVESFHKAMEKYPVYLFIDSLDQLSNRDEARSKLSFLRYLKVHERSKVVLSSLPDEREEDGVNWKYLYLCERVLKQNKVPILEIERIGSGQSDGVKEMISRLLGSRGRTLTRDQLEFVCGVVEEPSILYLNLAVEMLGKWRSWERDLALKSTVKGVINQIFDLLERLFGRELTSWALSFITFSREGMTDTEMKDCLSLQEDVLKEVFQYSTLSFFPMHVWLRLRFAMENLLVEREGHAVKWYHRQLWEESERRFSDKKKQSHEIMGRYFGNLVSEEERDRRLIANQNLSLDNRSVWQSDCVVNSRRVKEAYYHLVEGGLLPEAIREMCAIDFVCSSSVIGDSYNVLRYMGNVADLVNNSEEELFSDSERTRIDHYYRWMQRATSEIANNKRNGVSNSAGEEPTCSLVREEVCKGRIKTDIPWCLTFNGKTKFTNLISTFWGHSSDVASVAWSPDGSRIVSGSYDRTIKIWDGSTGEVQNTLEGHGDSVSSVAWSPDGSRIVSGSGDRTIKVWDARTGEVQHTLEGHGGGVSSVAWSPDGSRIVSGSDDTTIKVWDVRTGEVQHTLEDHRADVVSVAWSPDGSSIVSGSDDTTIKVWDVRTGEVQHTLEDHRAGVASVAWSPDGSSIVSGSYDTRIKVWDVRTGEVQNTMEGHVGVVSSVAWSPDGSSIVSGSGDLTIKVWDGSTGEMQCRLEGHTGEKLSLAWSPDGSRIVSVSGDLTIKVWDGSKGAVQNVLEGHCGLVLSVAWSPDGSRIVSGSDDMTIKVWDGRTGEMQNTLEGHSWVVFSVAWSPDGSSIVSGSADMTIKVWDARVGEVRRTLQGHGGVVLSVAWSPDGSRIVSGSGDKTIKVWDVRTGAVQNTLEGHSDSVSSVAWSPDGSRIVSGSEDKTIKVWDVRTGEVQNTMEGHNDSVSSVAWSPDGSRIVSGSRDLTIKVWDVRTGEVQNTMEGHNDRVSSVAWSLNGSGIVSGSYDKTIKVWDVRTGEVQNTMEGHSGVVLSVAWSPDGSRISSGSGGKTVKVWDGRWKGQVQNTLEVHSDDE